MNELVAKNPNKEIHVVLDNLNTHKPKQDRWLKVHPQVHFHFIPTRSSWLNQVECWFSILSRGALQGASFTSVKMLIEAIQTFIASWNQHATPFIYPQSTAMLVVLTTSSRLDTSGLTPQSNTAVTLPAASSSAGAFLTHNIARIGKSPQ